ncbi:hypothetical protein [Mesorhizobium sp. M0058]|uniref:hypothetical protein n=1 Tax=Mesorhizobium sp. M0058 TaxID=2956865 RepID=UPI00333795F4
MSTIAIIGHGRSPEGKRWGPRVDGCDLVVRMWDCAWQASADYGGKYDYGLIEAHPAMMLTFQKNNRRRPARGWIASKLHRPERCGLPPKCELVDQAPWNQIGQKLGGMGATGRLQFTRGTIATCWAIENAPRGSTVVLVGFDNIVAGRTLELNQAFAPVYQRNPGTFSFGAYKGGVSKAGNHDFAVELPVMQHLAAKYHVRLVTADEIWPSTPDALAIPSDWRPEPVKTALILGDAASVRDDAAAALKLFTPTAIAAANNIGIEWEGHLDYWFTLHPGACIDWIGIRDALSRRVRAGRNKPEIWAHKAAVAVDRHTPDWGGSTGLLAGKGLLELGFERIVLAGVPMDKSPHFYNGQPWRQVDRYRQAWQRQLPDLAPFVRSMSGWTAELLGKPDPEWLGVLISAPSKEVAKISMEA